MAMNIQNNIRSRQRMALGRPLDEIAIFLTTYCNLACKMCSFWKKREYGVNHDKVLSLLDEARALGATRFISCGAEIFMREDIFDILSYAERIGFQEISIVSNGSLLNDKQRLEQLEKLRTLCVTISLDGPKEVHEELRGKGVFDKAVETLRELSNRGITVSISSVIMRQTLDRLTEIIDLAAELGIPVISMQPYEREAAGLDNNHNAFEFRPEEEGTVREKLKNLMRYARLKKIQLYTANMMKYVPPYLSRGIRSVPHGGCFVPSRLIVVDTSGNCYPCFMFRNLSINSMGNIKEESLKKTWHNQIHKETIQLVLQKKCPGCLASCSDVDSYNLTAQRGRVSKLITRLGKRIVREMTSA